MGTPRRAWMRWTGRVAVAAGLALGLGYLPYQLFSHTGVLRYLNLRGESARLRADNRQLAETNLKLRAELNALTEDSTGTSLSREAIERIARDELGLVRPGEIVFAIDEVRR